MTVYTCPSGKTAIVKSLHLSNNAGSATTTIVAVASGAAIVNLRVTSLASNDQIHMESPYLVMEPGDELLINADQTNAIKYWVSGVELQGLAP